MANERGFWANPKNIARRNKEAVEAFQWEKLPMLFKELEETDDSLLKEQVKKQIDHILDGMKDKRVPDNLSQTVFDYIKSK